MRLFVSYAHVDTVRIADLGRRLAEGGLEPWWDDRLQVGDDWKGELRRQISSCEAFLCAVSADFNESQWCQWELVQAIALSKFIVPVLVRPGSVLPRTIAGLQYLDLSGNVSDQDVTGLVDRLARLKQNGALNASADSLSPHGSPSRFVQALPRTYRTVAQGYLRPESPEMHRVVWPEVPDGDESAVDPRVVGIDFGTTTCAVAIYEEGELRLVPNDLGESITPSAVAIALDGTPLVGSRALEFLLRRPERGVVEPKRLLGREVAKEFGGAVVLEVDGISYRPVDLVALVLQKLRLDASLHFGAAIRKAVLTAPAHFDPTQLAALSHAARLAGWQVLRQLTEPVAACLGEQRRLSDGPMLVYDLGGGTFDVSVVDMTPDVCAVMAVNGDTALGGVDFDRVLVDHCAAEFAATTGIDLRGNAAALIRVREAAEEAKIQLSSAREVTISVPFVVSGPAGALSLDVSLTRTRYNELTHDLVARTIDLTRIALEDSGDTAGRAGDIPALIVGRATRTPSVRAALDDFFHGRMLAAPDHVVAFGAAVQAGILSGELKDKLLIDVTAHTLRVQIAGGRTEPCLVRHTSIPTIQTLKLAAQTGSQRSMVVQVLCGESSWPEKNLPLLRLDCPLIQQARGQPAQVEVTFDIDANGILRVRASDSTGQRLAVGTVWLGQPDPGNSRDLGRDALELSALLPLTTDRFRSPPPSGGVVRPNRSRAALACRDCDRAGRAARAVATGRAALPEGGLVAW